MRELIVRCDICKKNIDNTRYKGSLKYFSYDFKIQKWGIGISDSRCLEIKDMCQDCAQKIHDFIEGDIKEAEENEDM